MSESKSKQILVFSVVALFGLSLFAFPLRISSADVSNGQLSGNLNYNTCNPCKSSGSYFQPDNTFDWTTTGLVVSGSCSGCWGEQVQLYDSATGGNIIYQEALIEVANGYGGCTTYTWCNEFCIADWLSNSGCISQSFSILGGYKLDKSGWTEEFTGYISNGYVQYFGLTVTGPNSFYKFFTITDPNQAIIYATRMNIVGADASYSNAAFSAGAGTLYYYNAGYHALFKSAGYTGEDSNVTYGSMSGNGYTTITQSFSY